MMVVNKTRTQRRMEKKQALILLVLVLIVSLSSFTLGVIVGRRGAERDMAQTPPEPRRIMVAEVPKPQPVADVVAQEDSPPVEEDKLTFYDNLSRGETVPLGSGINLPPQEKEAAAISPTEKKPVATTPDKIARVEDPAPVKKQTPAVVAEIPEKIPAADAKGKYSVQVGSFSSVADAGRLKTSLQKKGYSVFIAEADLGPKGIWYRVRLGPYADADEAKKVLLIADKRDNVKGFVSRL